ncbi:hypothetical protein [Methanosarcina barkeri]|uniref:hypothetical protein n=1 Tax=Methanosarcina barkeri TaxID=2208 RepID=UPI000AC8D660|nr:hypothetical protein [Methanosarcina barkeri]
MQPAAVVYIHSFYLGKLLDSLGTSFPKTISCPFDPSKGRWTSAPIVGALTYVIPASIFSIA